MVVYLCAFVKRSKERSAQIVKNIKVFVLDLSMVKENHQLRSAYVPLQMFFEVGIFTSAVWLSGLLGKNPQAANQIALNLSTMTFMVAMGLSVAAMIRVGNQKGLQDF